MNDTKEPNPLLELSDACVDMNAMLHRINDIMWQGFMIKDKGFSHKDGLAIMDVLNEWAAKY